jgi:hypothetical protein
VAAAYSWGARQTVARLFQHHPGFSIHHQHVNDLELQLSSSKFCLAPAGWGWGTYVKLSATKGCVPVIVQDGIKVEWDEQLPLQEYSLRLRVGYVHRLPELLEKFEDLGRLKDAQQVGVGVGWGGERCGGSRHAGNGRRHGVAWCLQGNAHSAAPVPAPASASHAGAQVHVAAALVAAAARPRPGRAWVRAQSQAAWQAHAA